MAREEQNIENRGSVHVVERESNLRSVVCGPVRWLKMLASKLHWSYVFAVVSNCGINQGFGYSLGHVATDYYMKDVQKVQPSQYQALSAITRISWIIFKPLFGILTDVLPIFGFHRRPYFILAGVIGVVSLLFISLQSNLHLYLALFWMTISSAAMAIADVTIDACTTYNSNKHPSLASDMQSLCSLSYSIGELLGFFMSGILVHLVGSKGVFGLLTFTFALVSVVGVLFSEPRVHGFSFKQNFTNAMKAMWRTIKCSDVWQPSLYMFITRALGLDIKEGLFYWFTDSKDGPLFAQETVGFILSIGSIGSILGVLLYNLRLKDHPFRKLFLWTQLLFALSGMFDLILVLRLNLKFGLPDYLFIVVDGIVSKMIIRLTWMVIFVLNTKLCPHGIEGTFFALLMSIDNAGLMTSSWLGGKMLHVLKNTFKLPAEIMGEDSEEEGTRNLELASLVDYVDRS
ncbi:Major facilitator superfamily protein [Arabidopsis thaliana]|uniref:Major facilitator superfamily protein n=1 Tax=Arabidopsis thaliana TaxID=3702 RepID=F4KIL9_ARATH|nr:Major facilitator superfamily protein [Arabidopsis thaliana]AED93391.1 Major facilitator superfamily protein [Arabidopsis thaliana]|eukprot:NP_197886.3 Major facilitator superfamily protein [Arabidopsis thaliana]